MYQFHQNPFSTKKVTTKHRKIVTDIPAPDTLEIINKCSINEPNSMNDQLPVLWDKAIGYQIMDNSGNIWIDFTSCIFVANIGHSHPDVLKSIKNTIDKNLLNAYYYPTKERADLSELLIKISPDNIDKALFLSTGSEAVEAAIKMAIKFTNRKKVLSFEKSFNGKTMGSQLAGGKPEGNKWIPVNTHVTHIPFPYPWVLEELKLTGKEFFERTFDKIKGEDYACVITEPYQGWCAAFLPDDYAKKLEKWCNKNKTILIVDEIQSGFGRTGKLFAFEHFDIKPDIITCAKGISSSLPLSAVLTRSEIANIDLSFNSTHGGNPVAAAASFASINVLLEEDLISESKRKGKILNKILLDWKKENPEIIKRVICKGLLASVFIESPDGNNNDFVDKLIEIAMRKGLLSVRTASGTLKIGPPLSIPDDALIEGVNVLKESLKECLDTLE